MKKERRGLNIEDVLDNPKYRNILFLLHLSIKTNKKIRMLHLRFFFVKNHKIDSILHEKLKNVVGLSPHERDIVNKKLSQLKKDHKVGKITEEEYKRRKYALNRMLNEYVSLITQDNIKFNTTQNLSNYLYRLKKLDLIKRETDEKGSYYILTEQGHIHYLRNSIKNIIDNINSLDVLSMILVNMNIEFGRNKKLCLK